MIKQANNNSNNNTCIILVLLSSTLQAPSPDKGKEHESITSHQLAINPYMVAWLENVLL